MASLRYAIRAYAIGGDGPATILTKVAGLLSVDDDGHFATVVCALVDIDRHEVTVANAGHREPLLLDGRHAAFISTKIGAPIGVRTSTPYESVTLPVPMDVGPSPRT
jgi:serine phosphatase RsbU (regulator of sigma subunit)